ncbi:carbohydrate-binding protein [Formosa sp. PL04]|uniref:carbohydrate-binding protein n=1 Tax=Formosa sp. PL04 TaxID=3081755 RepID=UPI002980F883|nr:carbohydrate-binding protein [Formosa sp. PL04]MDW5288128.1 carbohydrate-binding protein [Formosa sp. PL04]
MTKTTQFKLFLSPKNHFALLMFLVVFSFKIQAQSYPFEISENITATLEVQTENKEPFRNPLLGYNIFGFNSEKDKDLIREFDPTTIRFPHGLFANWYDWRADKTRVFGEETFDYIHRDDEPKETTIDHIDAINTFDNNNIKVGIDGMTQLNAEREIAQGTGFDVIWTFNMSADSEAGADTTESPETVTRYEDLKARGFEVKDIELGNENFYPGQRSSFIPNASDYIARAKSMAKDLKAKDPNIKVSIPLLRRGSWVDPNWNSKLTQDLTYFDAVTVHTYIGSDPDNSENSDHAYSTALTARKSLETSTNDFVRVYTGDKPIWLTEWGVKSGGPNAASVLGMADCYLFMSENQNIYQRANWFSVNGKLNSFVEFDGNNIKYPLEKTAYGLTHNILKNVFENSTMLSSIMTTENLEEGVKAVTARVVTKNGKTTVLVLNLTDKSVPFTLHLDGEKYTENFIHKAMHFDNLGQERSLPFEADPMDTIKEGSGEITLPALSINTIVLGTDKEDTMPTIALTSPLPYSTHNTGKLIKIQAKASDPDGTISKVEFRINDILYNVTDKTAPYEDNFTPIETGTYKITAVATDNDGNTKEVNSLIYVTKQEPYLGEAVSIPGRVEAENYDFGGQDLAYNDNDSENRGGAFRLGEGVDIGLTSSGGFSVGYVAIGEWIEYTVDVQEAGKYNIVINYSSGKNGGGTLDASLEGDDVFNGYSLPQTTSWTDYQTVTLKNIDLKQGEQILRLTINSGGYNLDYLEFKSSTLSIDDHVITQFKVFPNPSKSGQFTLSESLNWTVFSVNGIKLIEGKGVLVDVSKFAKGLYVLKTESGLIKKLVFH